MGAAPSVPTEAIQETATTTMKIFVPFYIKGYAAQLIKQLKREATPVPKEYHLMDLVPPSGKASALSRLSRASARPAAAVYHVYHIVSTVQLVSGALGVCLCGTRL